LNGGTTFTGEKSYKFEEILPIFKAVNSNPDNNPGTLAEFLEAFKTFDREGQGYINGAELRHVLKSLGTNRASKLFNIRIYATLCFNYFR